MPINGDSHTPVTDFPDYSYEHSAQLVLAQAVAFKYDPLWRSVCAGKGTPIKRLDRYSTLMMEIGDREFESCFLAPGSFEIGNHAACHPNLQENAGLRHPPLQAA